MKTRFISPQDPTRPLEWGVDTAFRIGDGCSRESRELFQFVNDGTCMCESRENSDGFTNCGLKSDRYHYWGFEASAEMVNRWVKTGRWLS